MIESKAYIISKEVTLYADDQANIIHFRNWETLGMDLYKWPILFWAWKIKAVYDSFICF